MPKQQKALSLRQQLAAINTEPQRLEVASDLYGTGNAVQDED